MSWIEERWKVQNGGKGNTEREVEADKIRIKGLVDRLHMCEKMLGDSNC